MESGNKSELERRFLVDYVRFYDKLKEHLGHVIEYLHGSLPFTAVLNHARNLPNRNENSERYNNIEELVMKLTDKEVPIITKYILTAAAYLTNGTKFESVDKMADEIIDLKPIPDTIIAPPDSLFYKGPPGRTLANMREEV